MVGFHSMISRSPQKFFHTLPFTFTSFICRIPGCLVDHQTSDAFRFQNEFNGFADCIMPFQHFRCVVLWVFLASNPIFGLQNRIPQYEGKASRFPST